MQLEQFDRCQPFIEAKVFGQEADLTTDVDVSDRCAEHRPVAIGWPNEAEQHLDGRTFPRTVRTEKAEDLALAHTQRQIADGDLRAELLAEAVRLDCEARD